MRRECRGERERNNRWMKLKKELKGTQGRERNKNKKEERKITYKNVTEREKKL